MKRHHTLSCSRSKDYSTGSVHVGRIALAAVFVAAPSVAAAQQSSVALYGTLDVALGKRNSDGDGLSKFSMISRAKGTNTSESYLGFKGVEDLGGGSKMGFRLEQGLLLNDGSTNPAGTFQRAAHIWLGGSWGTVQLGQAVTPSAESMDTWSLTRRRQAYDSVASLSFGYVSAVSEAQHNSLIVYKTPDINGFSAGVGHVFKDDNGGNRRFDLSLNYVKGPFATGFGYNKMQNHKASYVLGAQYRFGMFALAASYHKSDNDKFLDSNGDVIIDSTAVNKGFTAGGRVDFGAASVILDVARISKIEGLERGFYRRERSVTNVLLEGQYSLSKRTSIYGNYLRYLFKNNYSVGMRHDF